jgi:hypothetical protein
MKTNSQKTNNIESIIDKQLKRIHIKKLAKLSGFYKRKPRKIEAKKFIISFLMTIWSCKHNTYNTWANKLGLLINNTVSKQAVAQRVNKELVEFLRKVLQSIMKKSLSREGKEKVSDKLRVFKRIIIEDSTAIHLNDKLKKDYPSIVKNGKERATLKIQTAYEVTRKTFLNFELTSYRDNDQGYAREILKILKRGDLLIRDLGYFLLGVLKELSQLGVCYVSRLKKGVFIYLSEAEEPIDLASMLKKRGTLDMQVFLGKEEKMPARLIALPVEPEVAATRRRKARKDKNHGCNRRKDYFFLLGWNLLVTNISEEQMDSAEILKTYSMRWRIEIIFKSWKSCLGIKRIPQDANRIRLDAFIYCMLIFILMFQVNYYSLYSKKLSQALFEKKQPHLSMMKFTQYIIDNISYLICFDYIKNHSIGRLINKQISYYCVYEKRPDKINFNQKLACLG